MNTKKLLISVLMAVIIAAMFTAVSQIPLIGVPWLLLALPLFILVLSILNLTNLFAIVFISIVPISIAGWVVLYLYYFLIMLIANYFVFTDIYISIGQSIKRFFTHRK